MARKGDSLKQLKSALVDILDLTYQWLATILMWLAIASNFSHIQWHINRSSAVKDDWTTWAMAIIVEAGLGLSVHQAIACLRASLLSVGRGGITKQDRRFNLVVLPLSLLCGVLLGIFSAWCNTEFFGGDWILGSVAPLLTAAFAMLEASKEMLSSRRGRTKAEPVEKPKPKPEPPVKQAIICKECGQKPDERGLNEGECWRCSQLQRVKSAGSDKKAQILGLNQPNEDGTVLKQREIATILGVSPSWVSTVITESQVKEKEHGEQM